MSQRGAALVEFAIVVPLLLVICFGIIEFSVLLYDKAMLTNASREGARAGIVFIPTRTQAAVETSVVNAVSQYCANNLISLGSNSNVQLPSFSATPQTLTWEGGNSGDSLTVTVKYQFSFLFFSNLAKLFGGGLDDIFNLEAVTVMRLE